jgi:hypothetical protein
MGRGTESLSVFRSRLRRARLVRALSFLGFASRCWWGSSPMGDRAPSRSGSRWQAQTRHTTDRQHALQQLRGGTASRLGHSGSIFLAETDHTCRRTRPPTTSYPSAPSLRATAISAPTTRRPLRARQSAQTRRRGPRGTTPLRRKHRARPSRSLGSRPPTRTCASRSTAPHRRRSAPARSTHRGNPPVVRRPGSDLCP